MLKINRKKYKNLYFDLDRTLWDFKTNSEEVLYDLVRKHLPEFVSNFPVFLKIYYTINEDLWLKYRNGEITKETLRYKRFIDTLALLNIGSSNIATKMSNDYIKESPYKTGLFPNTIETLTFLKNKGYRMFLLTNGFKEVQTIKIKESNLEPFFKKMITSEEAGYQKPHRRVFEYALKSVNAKKDESIMIGDDIENDILGAKQFGMDTVFFNEKRLNHNIKPTYEIKELFELKLIF
jgi:putative hydrolase of the HAD superfamily